MRFRNFALSAALAAACLAGRAQVPAGFIQVVQSGLVDVNGVAISNATVCAQGVLSGRPFAYRVGTGAVTTISQRCAPVVGGGWSMYLPDGSQSNPLNAEFAITTEDNISGEQVGGSYSHVQPTSAVNDWCDGTVCRIDNLTPDTPHTVQTVRGQQGKMGPPGCVVGSAAPGGCGASLTPQALGNILYADAFPGADLAQRIAAAFASVAGTSTSPLPSATVLCSPGQVYTVTSGSIEVPRADMPPYIQAPIIDCQNSHISDGRVNSASPLIDVGPTNALSGATGSGMLINVSLSKDVSAGPILQMTDRLGYTVRNVDFVGGLDSIRMTSVGASAYYGPIAYPYLEQNHFENIGVRGCGRYGFEEDTQAGGTGSHLHNYVAGKFDLGGTCLTAVHIGAGSDASDTDYTLSFNTGPDAAYYAITVDGQYNSGTVKLSGEPTGNPGTVLYAVDGSAYAHPNVTNTFRGNLGFGANAQGTLPNGCTVGESYFLGRNGVVCLSSTLDVLMARNGNTENDSHAQFKACPTYGSGSKVTDSTTCENVLWIDSLGEALFGSCWNDSKTPCILPGGQYGAPGLAVHGFAVVAPTPATGPRYEYGVKGQADGSIVEYQDGAAVMKSAILGGASGTWFTGKCPAGTTPDFVLGRAVGCS